MNCFGNGCGGNNSCLWAIILMLCCGGCGGNGFGKDNNCLWIILLLLCCGGCGGNEVTSGGCGCC